MSASQPRECNPNPPRYSSVNLFSLQD